MKNNCTIIQYVSDIELLKKLVKLKVLPLVVYTDREKLPKKFHEIYSIEWFDIGKKHTKVFYSIDGNKLVKLISDRKLIPKYFIFDDGKYKKIDKIYPIGYKKNRKIINRKKELKKKNMLSKKCLISCSSDLWIENEYFDFGGSSLSEQIVKKYKKENK